VIEYLLEQGANKVTSSNDGFTPLNSAALNGVVYN
jgi:hypothetical protein